MERLEVALRREAVRRRLAGESPEVIAASWAVRAGGEPSRGSIERLQTDVTRLSDGAEQLGQSVEDPQPRVDELEQRQSADGSSPRRGARKPNTSPMRLRIGAGAADDGSYIRTA